MKFPLTAAALKADQSPPARGAWIEIRNRAMLLWPFAVAPRTGGVD